jgi:hypothetical protein
MNVCSNVCKHAVVSQWCYYGVTMVLLLPPVLVALLLIQILQCGFSALLLFQ